VYLGSLSPEISNLQGLGPEFVVGRLFFFLQPLQDFTKAGIFSLEGRHFHLGDLRNDGNDMGTQRFGELIGSFELVNPGCFESFTSALFTEGA